MKKRQAQWEFGNVAFPTWDVETPAGRLLVRRNHPLVRTGARLCQGWDVWLDGLFAGALGSRALHDLATLSRAELLAALRPACCGRHREFQEEQPRLAKSGGVRPNAGRKPRNVQHRVSLSTWVEPRTLTLIDERRGTASRGQYLDRLLRRRRAATT
jgi:hypothetical protein